MKLIQCCISDTPQFKTHTHTQRQPGWEGTFGGEYIHVYVWMSPFAVHVKPSQHC